MAPLWSPKRANVFRASVDRACMAGKRLEAAQLDEKARELLVRYGARIIEAYVGLVDLKKLEAALEARAGPGVKDEMARLRSAPEVAEFIRLSAPARFVDTAEQIVELFERYLVVYRFRLAQSISPLDRRRSAAENTRGGRGVTEPLLAGKRPAALARYLELTEIIGEEYVKAFDRQGMLRFEFFELLPRRGSRAGRALHQIQALTSTEVRGAASWRAALSRRADGMRRLRWTGGLGGNGRRACPQAPSCRGEQHFRPPKTTASVQVFGCLHDDHPRALTAGVRKAPRHEIAGGGSPPVQRAMGN